MTGFSVAFTAIGRGFVRFVIGCVKCKPLIVFGLFLILAIIFNTVTPLSFFLVIASYVSGAVLGIWVLCILMRTKG